MLFWGYVLYIVGGILMTQNMKKPIVETIISILEFILVLVIVLECNSVYRAIVVINYNPKIWALRISIITAFMLIVLHIVKDRSNFVCIKDYKSLFLISFLAVLEFNALNALKIPGTYFLGYFLFFMNEMVILYRIYRKENDTFRLIYLMEYVILFIAVASVFLWIGSSILELWGRNPDVFVNWGGIYYDSNYLNLCIRRWHFAGDATKNLGIFVEPPMYGLFLGFGVYTELFLKKKSNPAIVAAFFIAVLSNRAVLTMMICLAAILFLFIEMIKGKKYAKFLISLMILATLGGIILLYFYKKRTGWGSLATHIDDFAAALKCWIHYPILGCGFDSELPIRQYMSEFRSNNLGLSNSAAVVLAEGGIVLFSYYFLPFALMMSAFFKRNARLAYWAAGMFMFWVVVIFHTRLFIFFLLALGYSMIDLKVHLFHIPKKEKVIDCSLWIFQDNLSEEAGYFQKQFLNLPVGFLIVSSFILSFVACFGLMNSDRFSVSNAISAIIILLAELAILIYNVKTKKLTGFQNSILQILLWLFYMAAGQPYQVINYFYSLTGLHIQTKWWLSIVLAILLYSVGVLAERFVRCKGNSSGFKMKKSDIP